MSDTQQADSTLSAAKSATVTEADTAVAFGDHFPRAAATPWVLGLAEVACHNAILTLLEPGEVTVGTRATIEHLAPTPVGATVTATATLIKRDRRRLSFDVVVTDSIETCAHVTHDRAIVDPTRMIALLEQKSTES